MAFIRTSLIRRWIGWISIVLGLLSLAGAYSFGQIALRGYHSRSWPETSAQVANTRTYRTGGFKRVSFVGKITFRYLVDGHAYSSSFYDARFEPKKFPKLEKARSFTLLYEPGKTISIYYDPLNPSHGLMVRGLPRIVHGAYIFASLFFVVMTVSLGTALWVHRSSWW